MSKNDLEHEKEAIEFIKLCGGERLCDTVDIPESTKNCDFIFREDGVLVEFKRIHTDRVLDKITEMEMEWHGTKENLYKNLRKVYSKGFKELFEESNKQFKATKELLGNLYPGKDWACILMISNCENKGDRVFDYKMMKNICGVNVASRDDKKSTNKAPRYSSIDSVLFASFKGDSNVVIDIGHNDEVQSKYIRLFHRDKTAEAKLSEFYLTLRDGYKKYVDKLGICTMVNSSSIGNERVRSSMDPREYNSVPYEDTSLWLFPNHPDEPDIYIVK